MTPDQALDLLDRAAALATMPRQDHATVIQAVQVLRQAIAPPPKETPAAAGTEGAAHPASPAPVDTLP